jgi:phosphopantetheinyl transferase
LSDSLPEDLVTLSVDDVVRDFFARQPRWLAPEEETLRRSLGLKKRHDEWLAGRIAAKRAAQMFTGLPFRSLVIRRSVLENNRGQPELFVDGHTRLPGHLSISHAAGYAAASYTMGRVGVDLERIFFPEASLLETAFSVEERARLSSVPDERRAAASTLAWCQKEAYAKWLGRGFALPLVSLEPALDPRVSFEQGALPFAPEVLWARATERESSSP